MQTVHINFHAQGHQSCAIVQAVLELASTSADTQYFVNEDMGVYLGVFEDGGAAAYEICETGGECHAYGDVNDGMVARRRRRLLQKVVAQNEIFFEVKQFVCCVPKNAFFKDTSVDKDAYYTLYTT